MSIIATSKKYYRLVTLKKLIQTLFKKYNLNNDIHFDVWICGYCPNGKADTIKKDDPWACCHFESYERTDGNDVFQWLEFEVEDYEFEITETPEYRLYVKLCDINGNFRGW